MKYNVLTYAVFKAEVEVEADSEEEALITAHEQADYQYDCWYDATAHEVKEEL